MCEDQLFLSIENRVRSCSARLTIHTGVLPTVDIKQIKMFVPTDSSCSYCHSQPTRFHSMEAEIPLVNNTSWSADGIVVSIHVPLGVLPTCMYGGFMADVYENGRMKSGHKSHPILINSSISLQILYTEEINVKTKDWYT